jgi:hypothetical protein
MVSRNLKVRGGERVVERINVIFFLSLFIFSFPFPPPQDCGIFMYEQSKGGNTQIERSAV